MELKRFFFIMDLVPYGKHNTSVNEYQQRFLEIKAKYTQLSWNFIYTDGSKTADFISFAVADDNSHLIANGFLAPHCSVFTAEAVAILTAIEHSCNTKGKHIICSDSLSTISTILNPVSKSAVSAKIRDKLIQFKNKLKLMWVPGHAGIPGNEMADNFAKNVSISPTFMSPISESKDLQRAIQSIIQQEKDSSWHMYSHTYKNVNPSGSKASYPKPTTASQLKPFIRLRLGHTIATHQHLLTGTMQRNCLFCNQSPNTTLHILDECPSFQHARDSNFPNQPPSNCLMNINNDTCTNLYKFLKEANLLNFI